MIAPQLVVVGHSTSTSAAIFCCTDRPASGDGPVARLAWRAGAAAGAGVSGRLLPVMEEGSDVLFRRNFAVLGAEQVSFVAEGLDQPLTIPLPRQR